MGHSLLAHALDVGLVAEVLLERGAVPLTGFDIDLGLDEGAVRPWLVTLVGLHDLGKATPAFQRLWPAGAPPEALLQTSAASATPVPHGKATIILLAEFLIRRGVSQRLARQLAHAVGIHHGVNVNHQEIAPGVVDERSLGAGSEPWESWREAICDDVIAAFAAGKAPSARRFPTVRVWALLAGLTSVSDWIGSSLAHAGAVSDVATYLHMRRPAVVERLSEIGLAPAQRWWSVPDGAHEVNAWLQVDAASFTPRPLQVAMLELFSDGADPGLIVLEAPTGEGKTEAAFLSMVQAGAQRGAYFALPTQATSNAMSHRIAAFTQRHQARPVALAVAHGGARMGSSAAATAADAHGAEAQATSAAWFSTGRRELLAELGVGTLDQALLGVLPTKHHFVRLFALAGRTLIVDEVHAYDTYTSALLESLLAWAAALNVRVVLMSATLPHAMKASLVAAYQRGLGVSPSEVAQVKYPRLTTLSRDGRVSVETFVAVRSSSVRFESAPFAVEALLAEVLVAAEGGGAVGVIVNTVARAQALTVALEERGVEVFLLHARLPANERRTREHAILQRLGPNPPGDERTGVFVGTQVLEQSLDLDFDTLFTDLAPIDLLLQRAGRLHRHTGRIRPPAHKQPLLRVVGYVAAQPDVEALKGVYAPATLWRTWAAMLACGDTISLPDDFDRLVQGVYGNETYPGLSQHQEQYTAALTEAGQQRVMDAKIASIWQIPDALDDSPLAWNKAFAEETEARPYAARARTRLGDRSLVVVPMLVESGGWRVFGGKIIQQPEARAGDSSWILEALDARLTVQRRELIAALDALSPPPCWGRSGPLKFMKPLLLDSSGRAKAWPRAKLDSRLGLVYDRS